MYALRQIFLIRIELVHVTRSSVSLYGLSQLAHIVGNFEFHYFLEKSETAQCEKNPTMVCDFKK